MRELPTGWTKEPLSKLGTWTGGGTPTTTNADYWTNGTIPWVSPKDMKQRRITTAQDSITEAAVRASTTNLIPENSVMLVTRSGILRHSLPVALNMQPVTLNQDMKALTPLEALWPDYLYFAFRRYERDILHGCCKGGTTVQSIEAPRLMAFEIPIAPLAEQRRIVAKIEELFSELDEGVANLKKARAQLVVYRQALLKHAFEGHLTAHWRAQHADQLESADQLLARIREEREARYQQQLNEWQIAMEKWEADGSTEKKPSKPTKPAFGISKVGPDKMLPKAWAKLELEYLAVDLVLGKMLDKAKNIGKLRPYLGNINVRWGAFELRNLKEMRIEESEVARYRVEPGDLVICEGGEPGRCAIWKASDTEVFIQKALHRVRFTDSFDSRFACLYLTLVASTQQLEKYFTGTTIKHLTGAGLAKIEFPLCSVEEQREIISKLEAQISAIDVVEADIDLNLQKAEALRQSILKKAFAGELVPQDPADEPASELLARIRAERETRDAKPAAKRSGKRPPKTA